MPLLSDYAAKKKINYFIGDIPKTAKILEVGSGSGWLAEYMKKEGWLEYKNIDLSPPADYVGDIRNWEQLNLEKHSFDVIVAFEVVEHIHCFEEFHNLLKDDGTLMLTTPVPHMDWLLKILETTGLNQQRTSPHDHLIYLKDIPLFKPLELKTVGFMAQWGKFKKI